MIFYLLFFMVPLFFLILLYIDIGITILEDCNCEFMEKYENAPIVFVAIYPYIFLKEFIRQFKKFVSDNKYSK